MPLRNEIMLITYADSMGRDLRELMQLLKRHFDGEGSGNNRAVGSIHLLPFFPSSADRGFAPTEYEKVDESFGTWKEVSTLAARYDLMVDFMINHISRRSRYFQDFVQRKERSPFAKMFIQYRDFWPAAEPTEEELSLIYRRKPRPPYVEVTFGNGSREKVWCTFDEEQIDLDLSQETTRDFVRENLIALAHRGTKVVRLDAFAYAVKKPGTSCFFVEPEIWELLDWSKKVLEPYGIEILPEIHENHSIQLKLAERGYWVYDFALSMLLLHTLYTHSNERLLAWLKICPRRQFTTLDTHDGIGVVDVRGLLSEGEIESVREQLFSRHANVKRVYNTSAYNNLDVYQINCTYYSALGGNDDAYLLARAIQFFTPGIPQVYYVGLLAGENDVDLVETTKIGRDINRHRYTKQEVERNLQRPVVQRLIALMRFRNSYPAFSGDFRIVPTEREDELHLEWREGHEIAELIANLRTFAFKIHYFDTGSRGMIRLTGI